MTVTAEKDMQLLINHNVADCGNGIYAMPFYLRGQKSGRIERSGFYLWHPQPGSLKYCKMILKGQEQGLSKDWPDVHCPNCGLQGEIKNGLWNDRQAA